MATATYSGRQRANLPTSRQAFTSRVRPLTGSDTNIEEVIVKDRKVLRGRSKKARDLGAEFAERILTPVDQAVTLLQQRITNIRAAISSRELRLSEMQVHTIEARIRNNGKLARLNNILTELQTDAATLEAASRAADKEELKITHGMNTMSVCRAVRIEIGSVNQDLARIGGGMRKDGPNGSYYANLRIEAIRLTNEIAADLRSEVEQQAERNERVLSPFRKFASRISALGSKLSHRTLGFAYQAVATGMSVVIFLLVQLVPANKDRSAYAAPPTPAPSPAAAQQASQPTIDIMDEHDLYIHFSTLYGGRIADTEFISIAELFLSMKTKDSTFTVNEFIGLYNFHRAGTYDAISNRWKNKHEKNIMMALFEKHLQTKRELKAMIKAQEGQIAEQKLNEIDGKIMLLLSDGMFKPAMRRHGRGNDPMALYRLYGSDIKRMCARALAEAGADSQTGVSAR